MVNLNRSLSQLVSQMSTSKQVEEEEEDRKLPTNDKGQISRNTRRGEGKGRNLETRGLRNGSRGRRSCTGRGGKQMYRGIQSMSHRPCSLLFSRLICYFPGTLHDRGNLDSRIYIASTLPVLSFRRVFTHALTPFFHAFPDSFSLGFFAACHVVISLAPSF